MIRVLVILLLAVQTVALCPSIQAQAKFHVTLHGRVLGPSRTDTVPLGRTEVRLPSGHARTWTDPAGRFELQSATTPGCHLLYLRNLIYHLDLRAPGDLDLGVIVVPEENRDDFDLEPEPPLAHSGTCSPGPDEEDYNWVAARATVRGTLRSPTGEPISRVQLIIRCTGIYPERAERRERRKPPVVFVSDERPFTDSSGRFEASLPIHLDRATWVTDYSSVPCTAIIWQAPYDTVAFTTSFAPDSLMPGVVTLDLVPALIRNPSPKHLAPPN